MALRALLGRRPECAQIDALLDQVRDGRSGILVLVGEAGIGKTRLLEFAAEQASDLRLAHVVGAEAETELGYAALHRLLRPYLDGLPGLPEPQAAALRAVLGLAAGPAPDRFLIGLATLTLLAGAAADRPLLCLIDDAHWVDRESLEVLAFVGRRLHADAVGLVFALRDGAVTLAGFPTCRVAGLPTAEARKLLFTTTATGRIDGLVERRVLAETEGNPLALIEVGRQLTGEQLVGAAALSDPLPVGSRLDRVYHRRIAALPPPTQLFLLVTALVPAHDPALLWAAAARLELPPEVADPAVADGILSNSYRFRHPMIRSAVQAGAPAAERRRVHRVLAELTDRQVDPVRRAGHLAEASVGPDADAAAEIAASADRAGDLGGYAAQAALLSRAAELSPDPAERAARLVAAAGVHLLAGDPGAATELLDRAQPLLAGSQLQAEADGLRAGINLSLAQVTELPALLLAAAPLSRDTLLAALGAALVARDHLVGTTLHQVGAAVLARPREPGSGVAELLLEGFGRRITGSYREAAPALRAAVDAMCTDGTPVVTGVMPLAVLGGLAATDLWDDRAYRDLTARLGRSDRSQGALVALRLTLANEAATALRGGRFGEAEAHLAESEAIRSAIGVPPEGASHVIELMAWRGLESETRAAAADLLDVYAGQYGIGMVADYALVALTVLDLGLGRYPEALASARRVVDGDAPCFANLALSDLVEAAVRSGERAAASTALARLDERATVAGTPWALGLLARSRALLAAADADAHFQEAFGQLSATKLVTEIARTHLLHGEWLRRRKRRTEARDALRRAHDLFTTMGAAAFAERARVELVATGVRVGARKPATDGELTPQETQVARLAGGGATNAEIATRLFITTSTVEFHLSKVFRKLALTSRRQLAVALLRE